MDANNDSSQAVLPQNQPDPVSRSGTFVGYQQRGAPTAVAPRPNAFTATALAPQPPAPDVIEDATPEPAPAPADPVETLVDAMPSPEPALMEEPAPAEEPVAVSVAPEPSVVAAEPEIQMPHSQNDSPPPQIPSPRPSLGGPVIPPGSENNPIDDFRPAPAVPVSTPRMPDGPVITEATAPATSVIDAVVTAPTPSPVPALAAPAAPVVSDFVKAAPSLAPVPSPTPVAAPAPMPVVVAAPAPAAPQTPPTPPARPYASPASPQAVKTDTDHITNHLESQKASKRKPHFGFLRRHGKAVTAAVFLLLVVGGGGGYYLTRLGAAAATSSTVSWVSYATKDDKFSAKFIKAPTQTLLKNGVNDYSYTDNNAIYGVRTLPSSVTPNTEIAIDAAANGNGTVKQRAYTTMSGNNAISGTITGGSNNGRPEYVSFRYLQVNKILYELYTINFNDSEAPNSDFFFMSFQPAGS